LENDVRDRCELELKPEGEKKKNDPDNPRPDPESNGCPLYALLSLL
jgi:hypothetical protein